MRESNKERNNRMITRVGGLLIQDGRVIFHGEPQPDESQSKGGENVGAEAVGEIAGYILEYEQPEDFVHSGNYHTVDWHRKEYIFSAADDNKAKAVVLEFLKEGKVTIERRTYSRRYLRFYYGYRRYLPLEP